MHWYRDKHDGKERLWLQEEEFDGLMEAELREAARYPTPERPAVDIERFIQRHIMADLDQHADLPTGIAGAIEFRPLKTKIFISRRLTELAEEDDCSTGVRGRWRATMAHEAAHGLLHRGVFETSPCQQTLFEMPQEQEASRIIECSDADIGFDVGSYDWREYQANRAMAALLMPRQVFIEVVRKEMARLTRPGQPALPGTREYDALVRRLSVSFEVSRRATAIRLKALEGAIGVGQARLVAVRI